MIKKGFNSIFLFYCSMLLAQNKSDSLTLNFHLEFDKTPLELHKKYTSTNKDTLAIETFRCYVSNIQIQYSDNSVFIEKDSYHLLDSDKPKSFQIPITEKNDKPISRVVFSIGIDSLTNTSGAMSGALDPVNGMYWAWQSGYINMKIEGKSPSCKTRKNEFQFHIGGYREPYYARRTIEIPIRKDRAQQDEVHLTIDLGQFFSEIHLKETNSIMIPGKEAMQISDLVTKVFSLP